MRNFCLSLLVIFLCNTASAQTLHLKQRKANAMSGTAFAVSIIDTAISLQNREELIFNEIKSGNIPDYLRNLKEIKDTFTNGNNTYTISYWVLPDYFAIGSSDDFFYIPMTPMLAQRVADLAKASIATKKIVDNIYVKARLKLVPTPMPPTKEMTTVRYFKLHSDVLRKQLDSLAFHEAGALTAGNKKDIIISNKIYGEKTPRVVIYGWHKADGKAIQPVYNKHTNTWADYSHGIRLIQNKMLINGKKTTYQKVLADPALAALLSDEGVIKVARYPLSGY